LKLHNSAAVCGSFVVANAHIADDNLKNLELRSEIVARVTQTTGQHEGYHSARTNGPRKLDERIAILFVSIKPEGAERTVLDVGMD
jgi:hypothetical protein